MSSEILSVLEYMEKEKGISRQDMIEAIVVAIKNAALKGVNAGQDIKVEINPKSGALKAWRLYRVVDSISDFETEMHIDQARQAVPAIQLGDVFEKEMDPSYLGRIAAQTARQAIMQRIRYFEKERLYDDYKSLVNDIVTGVVRRRERNGLVIDLGKAEALLPNEERIPGEEFAIGDRIRCLLLSIDTTPKGPEIILSRSHPRFVRRLIELEVSEIADGTASIKGIVREPGYRTKVAVHSTDPKVDPVGACVGARGARVKTIVRELSGEKVDILRYYEDPIKMVQECFHPANLKNIEIDERNQRIYFEVSDEDISSVIGRKGQNAKLTSRLMGWRIDIGRPAQAGGLEQRMRKAAEGLHQIPDISDSIAQRLVAMGITSPDAFEGVTSQDLIDAGFSQEDAEHTLQQVQIYLQSKSA